MLLIEILFLHLGGFYEFMTLLATGRTYLKKKVFKPFQVQLPYQFPEQTLFGHETHYMTRYLNFHFDESSNFFLPS